MPKFRCKDVGMDCPWEAEAESVDKLMELIVEHAKHDHGMTEIPPEMVEKVKAAIKD